MSSLSTATSRAARWLDRVQPSEALVMGAVALVVGLGTGAGVWLFKQLIEAVRHISFDVIGGALSPLGGWTVVLLPIFGGVVVGLLIHFFVGVERHHGVAGIMEATALSGGRLRYKRMPIKALAAGISIGAGASVGPEDPSVQIGANIGSMFGQLLHLSDDRVRVLVAAGAAAAIAAAFNAPIAGVFFALEIIMGELTGSTFGGVVLAAVISAVVTQALSGVQPAFRVPAYQFNSPQELPLYLILGALAGVVAATNDYRIILPLMFAVVVSLVVSQRLQRDSVYTLGLARKGIRLQRGRDVEVLDTITVGEVMQTDMRTLRESEPLSAAVDVFAQTRHHGLPVTSDAGVLVGVLTVQDIERIHLEGDKAITIGAACTHDVLTAFPDETIGAALRRMSARDIGRLPVVARDNRRHLVGVLRRNDLVRAYDIALTRRTTLRHTAQQVRLGAFTGAQVVEQIIDPDAVCVSKRVSEVKWPRDCVLASVRRGGQMIIPHGDTVLRAGDVLVAVVEGTASEELRRLSTQG